jgi:hypothetical protein
MYCCNITPDLLDFSTKYWQMAWLSPQFDKDSPSHEVELKRVLHNCQVHSGGLKWAFNIERFTLDYNLKITFLCTK